MSAGLVYPIAPIRTNKALQENIYYHDSLGPAKPKQHAFYPDKGTIIVRRPFKYLKHQGPRPVGATFPSTFKLSVPDAPEGADGTKNARLLPTRSAPMPVSHQRSSVHGSKAERPQTGADRPSAHSGQKNEGPYGPPASRLLRSRKLNLTALDISACQKRKSAQVDVVRDEATNLVFPNNDENAARSAGTTARLADWFCQSRTSCFSDWSNSAPTSSRCSATVCETPTQLYLPLKSCREIVPKKRITSDPRLPISLKRESISFPNTRSRSDFGLTSHT